MEERVRANAMWNCLEPFLNRIRPRDAIYSMNEFQQLIRYERGRSDRERSAFSVAVFDVRPSSGNGNGRGKAQPPKALVAGVKGAVRATDHVGWYGCRKIGVILPGATEDQAMMFTAKVQQRISEHVDPASTQVYSYQDGWLKRGPQIPGNGIEHANGDGNGNGNGNGNGHGNGNGDGNRRGNGNGNGNANAGGVGIAENIDQFCPLERGEAWSPSEPLEELFSRRMPRWKRILDVTGSIVAILGLAPVFMLTGIYIKLTSPGPVIFKQQRVGYRGKQFAFYKFRTMKNGNDQTLHGRHAGDFIRNGKVPMTKLDDGDTRIIRGGRILRKAAIDELPQLFNVLKGDMSLVGPRPCIVYEAEDYLRWHTHRFDIVPGITGLWQVNGKNDLTFKEMICMDISYCRNMSFLLDVKLLLATIPAIASEIRKAVWRRLERA